MDENINYESRIDLDKVQNLAGKVIAEVKKVIVGQDEMVEQVLVALLVNGHVLIEGVPGLAKTLTAKMVAQSIHTGFSRIQFTPDLMPSDVVGTSVFHVDESKFKFHQGPIFSNLVLIDEINRAPAKTQAALFEAMEERQITVEGQTYKLESPFLVFATQNPVEHEGVYKLPEGQLDRFLMKIVVKYPEKDEELGILNVHYENSEGLGSSVESVVSPTEIVEAQNICKQVNVHDDMKNYIVDIVRQTRNHPGVYLGASPRAAVYIMRAAQAFAAMQGNDFITPDDVKQIAVPVLRHRVILTAEAELEGSVPENIVKSVLNKVDVPN